MNIKLLLFKCVMLIFISSGCSSDDSSDSVAGDVPVADPERVTITEVVNGVSCGQITLSRRPLSFCYQDRGGQATRPAEVGKVVYYFHGLGGNEKEVFDGGNRFFDLLHRLYGSQMPLIVSLSLGTSGVMGDEALEIASIGIESLEESIAPNKQWRRVPMGGSLGGHNTLRLVAAAPESFAAVASLCPALATFNGHVPAEVEAYIKRHEPLLDRAFLERALDAYRIELPTAESWQTNNPFTIQERGAYDAIPIFMSVGRHDQLGFVEGAREFKRRADLRGANVEYRELPGPHCVFDVAALTQFIRVQL